MKIGIDARLISQSGVGRYIRNLIKELSLIDQKNNYVIYLTGADYHSFRSPNYRFSKRLVNIRWHTLKEQIVLPFIYKKDKLDLLHVPYFNAPILYPGKTVVTIHDLTIWTHATGRASTLPQMLYNLRLLGYRIVLTRAMIKSAFVITVSESTKKQILDKFNIDRGKIKVTYEGVDPNLVSAKLNQERIIKDDYFLYIGNAYPHKNLENLITGYEILMNKLNGKVRPKLVLVGENDYFYKRLRNNISGNIKSDIIFFGRAQDRELSSLYRYAQALVFPSLSEGFGLPALEALKFGKALVLSDIPVFREIFGNIPLYFDPHNPDEIANCLEKCLSRKNIQSSSKFDFSKYDWIKLARDTLDIYENCTGL